MAFIWQTKVPRSVACSETLVIRVVLWRLLNSVCLTLISNTWPQNDIASNRSTKTRSSMAPSTIRFANVAAIARWDEGLAAALNIDENMGVTCDGVCPRSPARRADFSRDWPPSWLEGRFRGTAERMASAVKSKLSASGVCRCRLCAMGSCPDTVRYIKSTDSWLAYDARIVATALAVACLFALRHRARLSTRMASLQSGYLSVTSVSATRFTLKKS